MFRELLKSKVLHKYRFLNTFYMLTIDGVGLQSFDYEPYPGYPFKKTEKYINANTMHWIYDDYKIFENIDYKKQPLFVVETLAENMFIN